MSVFALLRRNARWSARKRTIVQKAMAYRNKRLFELFGRAVDRMK